MMQESLSTHPQAPTSPRPGRPRSATAHEAILQAAVALFVEQGFEGMSLDAVASRAGVGKATIYRRWSSKEDVVIDAVARVFAEPAAPNTGNVCDDLVQSGRELQVLMSASPTGEVFPPDGGRGGEAFAAGSSLRRTGHRTSPRHLRRRASSRIERGELPATMTSSWP
jgi:AcrR family transcriptional regulator